MKSVNGLAVFQADDQHINKAISSKSNELAGQTFELNPSELNSLFPFGSCFVHHSGKQFACIHNQCQDFSICFRNDPDLDTLDYHSLRFHLEDREIWCKRILPDILQFINQATVYEFEDYRFSFNHRYILPDGSISQFLHEGTISAKGNKSMPVLNLKIFTEIGDIKTDATIVLSIFSHSADWGYQKVFTKVYSNTNNILLSPRELEIVRFCSGGLSSKMIADKLKLSLHTVKNHKRNCMKKTLTHNITELIHLCIQNDWL